MPKQSTGEWNSNEQQQQQYEKLFMGYVDFDTSYILVSSESNQLSLAQKRKKKRKRKYTMRNG